MPDAHPQPSSTQAIWFDSDLLEDVSAAWFTGEYWRKQGLLTGETKGRGTTYFFKFRSHEFVLRHYLRGGLIGKLLTDQYCYTGLHKTRAWRELHLLLKLRELGLYAPRPVAAMVERRFGYYRADIITERIAHATDVHKILEKQPLPRNIWQLIGHTIANFHLQQVYHHDLNIHNIMLDKDEKVWLIDFDKCAVKPGERWKQENLQRLKRSLNKEKNAIPGYHFTDHDWQSLMQGYAQSRSS